MTLEEESISLDKIDCNFPYHDRQESLKLIDEASKLSPNALFGVIEELCRIPQSEKAGISATELLDLLTLTGEKINHPLKKLIWDIAEKMINSRELTVEEAISGMKSVSEYPGQFAALSIVYFSCDDKDQKLESLWEEICQNWKRY